MIGEGVALPSAPVLSVNLSGTRSSMLTIDEYNATEAKAIQVLPVMHRDNIWGIDPDKYALRVDDLDALIPLLDRMHIPDRFEYFQYELGGLSNDDVSRIANAARKVLDLQAQHMSLANAVIPYSTLLATFAVRRKMKDAKPDVKSILEIGPGAGLTALYFEQDKQIEFYASIDSTQGCYLLQSLVHDAAYSKDWCEVVVEDQRAL